MNENKRRLFSPPDSFAASANISKEAYDNIYALAKKNPLSFWENAAKQIVWDKAWEEVLDWKPPFAKWFVGGKLNATKSCLDRHIETNRKNKTAIIWEGEKGNIRRLTYGELLESVCRLAAVLQANGIKTGDRIAIYMPLIPEAAIAMLACARIGATHSVVFGGFSPDSLRDRIQNASCKMLITADGGLRKGQIINLKTSVDEALKECPSIQHVIVYRHTNQSIEMTPKRDLWWHEQINKTNSTCLKKPVSAFASKHPLFILYTSGTTGKPKGIVHGTGGYLTQVAISMLWVFDLREDDIYWCSADVGWITGHSYLVYGPLACGATLFMYEGAPTHPDPNRFWEMIERHRISILYTAPTAIRTFIRYGDDWVKRHDLSSLRLLGTVGEPINPGAWLWYHETVGQKKCPIVDTWWQTETGAIMISPIPGAVKTAPGSATWAFPGIDVDIVRQDGTSSSENESGFLVIKKPWPAMAQGIWGDDGSRFQKTYWSQIPGAYFTGDEARKDEEGYIWITGRVDDVVNVSGHRLGTSEVESALVSHPSVAEAAVVARPDEVAGQAIVAFVTLLENANADEKIKKELTLWVKKEIGSFAKPAEIRFTKSLPKTRSGKIMRRLLRELACKGKITGDTTTLEDLSVISTLSSS